MRLEIEARFSCAEDISRRNRKQKMSGFEPPHSMLESACIEISRTHGGRMVGWGGADERWMSPQGLGAAESMFFFFF